VVREELGITNAEVSKKAGNIKLTPEQAIELRKRFGASVKESNKLIGGKRYVKEGSTFKVSVDFAKALNKAKAKPQDAIIISDRVFDYFNGYTELDNFANTLGEYYNESDFFQWTVELQVNGNILSTRGYLNFNQDNLEKISKYIESKGNNLNVLSKNNIEKILNIKYSIQNEKAALNSLSPIKESRSISTVSDFINANNLKRIDAETSFDVLNDLNKEIENYWGIVPNDVIVKMGRAVDYAFDVIEDRENEGGPLMAAVNDALNLETIKFAEKQLNEFIENNIPKDQKTISKFSLTSKRDLKWETNFGVASTDFKVGKYTYTMYMSSIKEYGLQEDPLYNKVFKNIADDLELPLTYLVDNKNIQWFSF